METINNESDYLKAKERFEQIYQVEKGHPDFDEMKELAVKINAYEKEHFAIDE